MIREATAHTYTTEKNIFHANFEKYLVCPKICFAVLKVQSYCSENKRESTVRNMTVEDRRSGRWQVTIDNSRGKT